MGSWLHIVGVHWAFAEDGELHESVENGVAAVLEEGTFEINVGFFLVLIRVAPAIRQEESEVDTLTELEFPCSLVRFEVAGLGLDCLLNGLLSVNHQLDATLHSWPSRQHHDLVKLEVGEALDGVAELIQIL